MTGRELARLGIALALGAAVAFPAGLMLARRDPAAAPPPAPASAPAASQRAYFSPKVLDDPYFIDQQRKNAEALEARCRDSGEMCEEARQLREWLDRQGAR